MEDIWASLPCVLRLQVTQSRASSGSRLRDKMKATNSRMTAETQLLVVSHEIHAFQTSPKYRFWNKKEMGFIALFSCFSSA
jgi:hypothetical protein